MYMGYYLILPFIVFLLAISFAILIARRINKRVLNEGPIELAKSLQMSTLHDSFRIKIHGRWFWIPKRFFGKLNSTNFLLSCIINKSWFPGTSHRYAKTKIMLEFPTMKERVSHDLLKNLVNSFKKFHLSAKLIERTKSSIPQEYYSSFSSILILILDSKIQNNDLEKIIQCSSAIIEKNE